jgi:hypothetical protein
MVGPLVPCPECARHVRANEPRCPFCRVALDLGDTPPPLVPAERLGRGDLLAFQTLVRAGLVAVTSGVAGCWTTTTPIYGAPDNTGPVGNGGTGGFSAGGGVGGASAGTTAGGNGGRGGSGTSGSGASSGAGGSSGVAGSSGAGGTSGAGGRGEAGTGASSGAGGDAGDAGEGGAGGEGGG